MEISPLFPLRIVCLILLVATLVTGLRAYPKYFGAKAAATDIETSGQRLYNKTQMVAVWLFCVILFGMMSAIL